MQETTKHTDHKYMQRIGIVHTFSHSCTQTSTHTRNYYMFDSEALPLEAYASFEGYIENDSCNVIYSKKYFPILCRMNQFMAFFCK